MTPTEMRERLSELGIESELVTYPNPKAIGIKWQVDGIVWKYDWYGQTPQALSTYMHYSPEQAIAATVGAGTCRNIAELNREGVSRYFFVCSECGLAVHASFGIRETNYPHSKPDGSTDLRTVNSNGKYEFERCPRCGRKITK